MQVSIAALLVAAVACAGGSGSHRTLTAAEALRTPGTIPGVTGQFDTYLSDGRAYAYGSAGNLRDSKIVQEDLARLAHEIAG